MEEAQTARPARSHKPPAYLKDYQTQFSGLPSVNPQPSKPPDKIIKPCAAPVEKSSADHGRPAPPSKPLNSAEGEAASMDMQVMRREIDQLRGLIMQVGRSVEALGDRLEAQPYLGASISPHLLPPLEDNDDTEQRHCVPQGSPPIVKELREKLCEHNIPVIHCVSHHPSPPALSRFSSLPPPSGALMPTPQPAKLKLSHATQTSGGHYDEQHLDFDVSSESTDMQQSCSGVSAAVPYVASVDLSSRQQEYYEPQPVVRAKSQISLPLLRAQDFRPASTSHPQLVVPPPPVTFSSSNPSYAQAPYVCSQTANNPPGPSYLQPRAPLYRHQLPPAALPHPQAISAHHCTAPSSLNVHSADTAYESQLVSQYPPQQSLRSHRAYPIAAPSFPYFTHEDPRQFAMLKMALTNLLPHDESEQFKYHVLLDHLKLDTACHLALAYAHHPFPFTRAMLALQQRYGQPHQLVLKEITAIRNLPSVRPGDSRGFSDFAIRIRALVGMLQSLENGEGDAELACASHVQQLLGKLPSEHVANYARFSRATKPGIPYNLVDFSNWLEEEAECQAMATQTRDRRGPLEERKPMKSSYSKPSNPVATILHGTSHSQSQTRQPPTESATRRSQTCPYCGILDHHISVCPDFRQLSRDAVKRWIQEKGRCWKCAREHKAVNCDLKKRCPKCNGRHLGVLHEANRPQSDSSTSCLIRSSCSTRVLLKVVKVLLSYRERKLETYAILDDGSERTMLLATAATSLGLDGAAKSLMLKTVRQGTETLTGTTVTLNISSAANADKKFVIKDAFTSEKMALAPQSYPVHVLQRFKHLRGLPLQAFQKVQPLLLIGSDHPHLVCPIERVRLGPGGGPAAVHTRLGWALQGPATLPEDLLPTSDCLSSESERSVIQSLLITGTSPEADLYRAVERLWKVDVLPYQSEKVITRSKQDTEALTQLDNHTMRVEINGVAHYATPLIHKPNAPKLQAPKESVLPALRRTERKLLKNPEQAVIYSNEINKLLEAGYVKKLSSQEVVQNSESSWYIPHHLVEHNGKHRLVFNCSFQYGGKCLNDYLLPGPVLGPSLMGVLLRFRQHSVAISGDIKGMFHQVRLRPEDRPFLRFIWRDMKCKESVEVYEWQVLPFGTTCSPCCATYALQRHVRDEGEEDVKTSVLQSFYVDNCLQSFPTEEQAKSLLDRLRAQLASGGFEIRQWISNLPSVVQHLPKEARAESTEMWLIQERTDPWEGALGLIWYCSSDTLGYKHRLVNYQHLTLRNVYRILAMQYDPLGFIIPFTTRAKVLLQKLWSKERDWDDPCLPDAFVKAWTVWEEELPHLTRIRLPRCYGLTEDQDPSMSRELHVFCDASEAAYGSVAYLRIVDSNGQVHVSFVMARSRVAPRRQITIPRLELCAALTGAQLARMLRTELTLPLHRLVMWTDSTTVLAWLQSESCQYKIFVAHRITEILENTAASDWRYTDSASNPADDITRGKTLIELSAPHRWNQGPPFLYLPPHQWPLNPSSPSIEAATELRKSAFCGTAQVLSSRIPPNLLQFQCWEDLVVGTSQHISSSSETNSQPPERSYVETLLLQHAQQESFPEEYALLQAEKPLSKQSPLNNLAPEFDYTTNLIRVGGRLRKSEDLDYSTVHPVILDPKNHITQLLIKEYDQRLHHPGPERVFASLRRNYWILRGRQAIRKHQHSCIDCRKWKAKPLIPRMADLPLSRLRLFKPPFWSTGMDCFGPFHIKVGRRQEKRWGILFKCLTTRCIHIDLLSGLDTDSFLMSFRRFVARRGTPFEVHSDHGTNFVGGERELQQAFNNLSPALQDQLAKYKVRFLRNPPYAPHFGGTWEREVRAIKSALRVTLGGQVVTEEVLNTVLIEVEEILNSKPLGYLSSDVSDPDPVTPNLLLMGRLEAALPQVMYARPDLLGTRRWRHSQVLADHFWASFLKNYLPALQLRQKWKMENPNLAVDTVVMIVDPNLPRASWPTGKVQKIIPSSDGRVRVAEIAVKGKTYVRPVSRLVALTEYKDDPDPPST